MNYHEFLFFSLEQPRPASGPSEKNMLKPSSPPRFLYPPRWTYKTPYHRRKGALNGAFAVEISPVGRASGR